MSEAKRLSEAQRRGLEFLAREPWVTTWWGGRPHAGWPKELNARSYDKLSASGLIGWKACNGSVFKRVVAITPAGRLALNPPTQSHLAGKGEL